VVYTGRGADHGDGDERPIARPIGPAKPVPGEAGRGRGRRTGRPAAGRREPAGEHQADRRPGEELRRDHEGRADLQGELKGRNEKGSVAPMQLKEPPHASARRGAVESGAFRFLQGRKNCREIKNPFALRPDSWCRVAPVPNGAEAMKAKMI